MVANMDMGRSKRRMEIKATVETLERVNTLLGEAYGAAASMPIIDGEQQRLVSDVQAKIQDLSASIDALTYRVDVFREKGVL